MDIKQKIKLIEDNNKKIDVKINVDYRNNINLGKSAVDEGNNLCVLNQKLVSYLSLLFILV